MYIRVYIYIYIFQHFAAPSQLSIPPRGCATVRWLLGDTVAILQQKTMEETWLVVGPPL